MGYYYDQRRKAYIGRVTVYGTRIYLGQFKTPEAEQKAEAKYLYRLASMEKNYTLENYKLKREPQDSGIEWLKPFRAWLAERKKARER